MMKQRWLEWQEKIDALNQRERVLLLITGLVAVVMLMQILFVDPLLAQRKQYHAKMRAVMQQLQQQKNEKELIAAQIAAGVNRHKEKRRDQLVAELAELDVKIQESVIAMIPPQRMPEVLEKILLQNTDLKLVSLENQPVVPLLADELSTADQDNKSRAKKPVRNAVEHTTRPNQGLYRHGFVLRLSGNYMAVIRYFDELSKLPWQFYWDDLHYEVEAYPNAIITLRVHTVSLSENWIGV